jgi:hypothetical protein
MMPLNFFNANSAAAGDIGPAYPFHAMPSLDAERAIKKGGSEEPPSGVSTFSAAENH